MNILVIILLVIVALIVLLLIIALFIKKDYTVARGAVVNTPTAEVFRYIKMLKNQDYYNKWWTMDPNAKKEFRGTDGTVGFVAAWDSDNKRVGKGEQEITRISEDDRIDFEIRFIRPFEGKSDVYMKTEPVSDQQTAVKWVFNGSTKYPMNIMYLFMNMDKMLGNDLAESLSRLKQAVESHDQR